MYVSEGGKEDRREGEVTPSHFNVTKGCQIT